MPLLLTVFSDFSCPYSYVTEAALRGLGMAEIEIVYRAFELFPDPEPLQPFEFPDEDRATLERLASFQGISFEGARSRPRTRKAHEASRFGRQRQIEGKLRDGIFRAYWQDGRDIGRIDVLTDVAAQVGADPEELKIALDIDRHHDEVLEDEALARRLRVPGTPTIFVGTGPGARVIAGAHGPAVLRTTIEDQLKETNQPPNDV